MTTPRQLLRKTLHQMGIVNVRGHLDFIKRRGMKYSSIFPYEGIPGWLLRSCAIQSDVTRVFVANVPPK